jgi:hypothetical protein
MQRDWERWLRDSSGPPPKKEDAKRRLTERLIGAAVNGHPALASLPLRIFTKGSFANRTNTTLESDVDIVVEYGTDGPFCFERSGQLRYHTLAQLGIRPCQIPVEPWHLKQLLFDALTSRFGQEAVEWGTTALRVRAKPYRLTADVVPALAYRLYYGFDAEGRPQWSQGHQIWRDNNNLPIQNWPDQHYAEGVAKNDRTGQRFKQMARAFKCLENELRDARIIAPVPSFLSECLVFNVNDAYFGHDAFLDDMALVLRVVAEATSSPGPCSMWCEVSRMKMLFGPDQRWNYAQANALAVAAWSWMRLG